MDINFGCFYRLEDSPSRVFKCVGMFSPYGATDGEDLVLVSEVKPNGDSVLTYIPIEDFLEQFEQLGN